MVRSGGRFFSRDIRPVCRIICNIPKEMPPKTHHTPEGFRNNYVGTVTKSLGDLVRWQFDRIRRGLPPPATIPTPVQAPDLDFVKSNAKAGQKMTPAVTWIGHATALVQASGGIWAGCVYDVDAIVLRLESSTAPATSTSSGKG